MVAIFITLFVGGFAYGLVTGNKKMFWLIRSLLAGVFFSLFFVTIPLLIVLKKIQDKKSGMTVVR